MNVKDLFLDACREQELGADAFLRYLRECTRYLLVRYPLAYLVEGEKSALSCPQTLNESYALHDRYYAAILRGVLYEKTKDEKDRARFAEEADRAYLSLWRERASGRRALPGGDGQ